MFCGCLIYSSTCSIFTLDTWSNRTEQILKTSIVEQTNVYLQTKLLVSTYNLSFCGADSDQGPVIQSVVSLTSWLRVISLTVLADSIYNILNFFAEKM